MKKIYLILMLVLLLVLPLCSAIITYQKGELIDLKIPFEVNGSQASSVATCNVSIIYPNNTYLAENESMTNNNNGEFNYTIIATKSNDLGIYTWNAFCCDALNCAAGFDKFELTYTGDALSIESSILYSVLLFMLVLMLGGVLFSIHYLPKGDVADEQGILIGINNLKYLRPVFYAISWGLILGIVFIISNVALAFLPNTLFGDFFFMLYRVMFIMTLPMLIIWFIYIFYKIWQDKEMKQMIERGVDMKSSIIY